MLLRRTSLLLAAALSFLPTVALTQTTRTEALEQQRSERARQLQTYKPGRLEKLFLNADEGRLQRWIAPHNGFFAGYGYTYKPSGAGFALRRRIPARPLRPPRPCRVRGGRVASATTTWSGETSPCRGWRDGRLELGVEGVYRHQPQDDFYGPGPDSRAEDRVSYLYKDQEFQGRAIVDPAAVAERRDADRPARSDDSAPAPTTGFRQSNRSSTMRRRPD